MLRILVCTFVVFLVCHHFRRFAALAALRADKRNDLMLQCFGLLMALLGAFNIRYRYVQSTHVGTHINPILDPIGAILIALVILFSWIEMAFGNVLLTCFFRNIA